MIDMTERPTNTKRRIATYLVVPALAVVLNALSFRTLDMPIVVGAGLLLDITFPDAASYLAMNQTPAGPNHSFFYGLVNSPREWLLVPLAVLLNWHLPQRRRLLVIALVVLYVERVITYLYFAPTVLSWQDTTPAQTTPALLEEVGRWLRLDMARSPVDWFLVAVLLFVVVAYPRVRGSGGPAAALTSGSEEDAIAETGVSGGSWR